MDEAAPAPAVGRPGENGEVFSFAFRNRHLQGPFGPMGDRQATGQARKFPRLQVPSIFQALILLKL